MRDFFSPLKGMGQYLRFLFITGISKFSQMSIFSELNNLQNISMRDDFSAICGITEQELLTELKPDIERMAEANNETFEEACAHLKQQYDGYHFSKHCADIYNPFSLFNAFNAKEYKNFWFSTGTPTFLIDLLRESDFDVRSLEGIEATDEQFDAPTERIVSPIPVLYQSGYLTIKGYDPDFRIYNLAYPNGEVRQGFPPTCTCRARTIPFMWFRSSATCARETSKAAWSAPVLSSPPYRMIWRTRPRSITRLSSTCYSA